MREQAPDPDVALTAMKLETEKCMLERERLKLEQERTRLPFFQRNWQAVISIVVSIAAAIVSVGQFYSARSVQRQEYAIKKVETLQRFLPDIASPEKRDAALLLLVNSKLLDESEVARLALALKATKVLGDMNTGGFAQAGHYETVLNKEMSDLIKGIFTTDASVRRTSAATLVSDWNTNPNLVPRLLDYAAENPRNENGIYNTVVVLENLSADTLRPYRESITNFAAAAEKIGQKTAAETTVLLRKVNTENIR